MSLLPSLSLRAVAKPPGTSLGGSPRPEGWGDAPFPSSWAGPQACPASSLPSPGLEPQRGQGPPGRAHASRVRSQPRDHVGSARMPWPLSALSAGQCPLFLGPKGAGMHSTPQGLESQTPFLVGAKAHSPGTPTEHPGPPWCHLLSTPSSGGPSRLALQAGPGTPSPVLPLCFPRTRGWGAMAGKACRPLGLLWKGGRALVRPPPDSRECQQRG